MENKELLEKVALLIASSKKDDEDEELLLEDNNRKKMRKLIHESKYFCLPGDNPCEVCGKKLENTLGFSLCAEENGHIRQHYCCSECKPIHKEYCFYKDVELEMTNGSWKVFTK